MPATMLSFATVTIVCPIASGFTLLLVVVVAVVVITGVLNHEVAVNDLECMFFSQRAHDQVPLAAVSSPQDRIPKGRQYSKEWAFYSRTSRQVLPI